MLDEGTMGARIDFSRGGG